MPERDVKYLNNNQTFLSYELIRSDVAALESYDAELSSVTYFDSTL